MQGDRRNHRKIDKNFIFKRDGLEEIGKIKENRTLQSRDKIKKIYSNNYSPGGYMRNYIGPNYKELIVTELY